MDKRVEEIRPRRGSFTHISTLRKSFLMLFPKNEDKKYILECPVTLMKCLLDLRPAANGAKVEVAMAPTLWPSEFCPQGSQVSMHHPPTFSYPMNNLTCFVIWNIRGMNNTTLKANLRQVIQNHKPCMVGLIETKMEEHDSLKEEFGFDDFLQVPAIGGSGGIVLMWKTNMAIVTLTWKAGQEFQAMIEVPVEEVVESSGTA